MPLPPTTPTPEAALMPTLVERLLTTTGRVGETAWCAEAADRIASLEAEVAALRKVITDHNIGCQQSCDARAESESCNRFHGYQRACSDCPVDWVIPSAALDSAIAAKGK